MCNLQYTYMLVILVWAFFSASNVYLTVAAPALYIFGDSVLDVGNNNYIKTLSKADKKPHGIDFGGPTGRYTNGRTIVDIICEQIGVKGYIPAYMSPTTKGAVVLKGVNYASGSSGILNETGRIFRRNFNLDAQIDNFGKTRQTILSLKGKYAGHMMLRSYSVFIVSIGSNDMLNNYLLPIISRRKRRSIPPEKFVSTLITRFRKQITRLYSLDARQFVVTELSPVGCVPFMRDVKSTKSPHHCYENGNLIAQLFNSRLEKLVSELKRELRRSIFIYVRIYNIFSDIVRNYKSYGFENSDSACCRFAGKHGGLTGCNGLSRICPDRSKYVFWDAFHPSEATYRIIANRILDGGPNDVTPMNLRQLLKHQKKY